MQLISAFLLSLTVANRRCDYDYAAITTHHKKEIVVANQISAGVVLVSLFDESISHHQRSQLQLRDGNVSCNVFSMSLKDVFSSVVIYQPTLFYGRRLQRERGYHYILRSVSFFFSRHTFSDVGKPTSPKLSHTTWLSLQQYLCYTDFFKVPPKTNRGRKN